jgi:hypothetical protein
MGIDAGVIGILPNQDSTQKRPVLAGWPKKSGRIKEKAKKKHVLSGSG